MAAPMDEDVTKARIEPKVATRRWSPLARGAGLAAVSLALAVGVVVAALVSAVLIAPDNAFLRFASAPGLVVWKLSNWVCPPFGERCFLLSQSQLAHHAWGLVCYTLAWWAIFGALIYGYVLTKR